jgi:hypothetical protein
MHSALGINVRRLNARMRRPTGALASVASRERLGCAVSRPPTGARASLASMGAASPRVVDDGWGFVEVEGLGRFCDVKLWPAAAEPGTGAKLAQITSQVFSALM